MSHGSSPASPLKEQFRNNNFDLIRLLAALQVAVYHSASFLGLPKDTLFMQVVSLIPGVPVFFFISGFLISKSWESNSNLGEYSFNRAMRIYPALIFCTLVAVASVYISGYFRDITIGVPHFVGWLLGQMSILQFYNPEFMRSFGNGVLNGSLWTITVELQFYVLTPLLYLILRRCCGTGRRWNAVLYTLLALFMAVNVAYLSGYRHYSESLAFKLLGVSFLPWFYMFLIGVVIQRHFGFFYRLLQGRALLMTILYLVIAIPAKYYFKMALNNSIMPILYIPMVLLMFSLAYSNVSLSHRLLRKQDLSYGVYIYHMPIINLFLYFGLVGQYHYLLVALLLTLGLAAFSWFVVERPAIKLKRHPLNPLQPSTPAAG